MPRPGLVLLALVLSACRGVPADDLAFLKSFRHTGGPESDGAATYRIFGNPVAIRAAIPNASSAKPEDSPQVTSYNFTLPSGRGATFLVPKRPGLPCRLVVDP